MPIRSMTGFARVSRPTASGELTLSIKTVNHRGLDLHFHMASEFDAVEPALRTALRKRITRGHVQVQVFYKREAGPNSGSAINEALLRTWLDSFRDIATRFQLDSKPDLNQALRVPGMIENRGLPVADADIETAALQSAADAIEELDAFRLREGEAI